MSRLCRRVLAIAGSDPSGGAGVQADLRVLAALEVTGLSAITALTDGQAAADREAYFYRINRASRDWWANQSGRAEQRLNECKPELRHWEWHYLHRLSSSRQIWRK